MFQRASYSSSSYQASSSTSKKVSSKQTATRSPFITTFDKEYTNPSSSTTPERPDGGAKPKQRLSRSSRQQKSALRNQDVASQKSQESCGSASQASAAADKLAQQLKGGADDKYRNQYVSSLRGIISAENGMKQSKSMTGIRKHVYEYEGAAVNGQNEYAYENHERSGTNGTEIQRVASRSDVIQSNEEEGDQYDDQERYGDSINLNLDISHNNKLNNNAMANESHFLNGSQSILEVEDEEAEPTRDYSRKSGSTQSKSSKSIGLGVHTPLTNNTSHAQNQPQENVYRAVDASFHVIQSSTAHDTSRTSPKKTLKNYNNITPILRESPIQGNKQANRPATTQAYKLQSPKAAPVPTGKLSFRTGVSARLSDSGGKKHGLALARQYTEESPAVKGRPSDSYFQQNKRTDNSFRKSTTHQPFAQADSQNSTKRKAPDHAFPLQKANPKMSPRKSMPAASPTKRGLHISTGPQATSEVSMQSNRLKEGTDSFITANNYDLPRSPGKVPDQQPDLNSREVEIDNLKTIIIALNQKVKARDDIEQELNQLKEAHKVANNAREELRGQLENASHAFAEEQEKSSKFQDLIIEENHNRQQSESQKDELIAHFENELKSKQREIDGKDQLLMNEKHEKEALEHQLQSSQDLDGLTQQHSASYQKLQQEIEEEREMHKKQLANEYDEKMALIRENNELRQSVQMKNAEIKAKDNQMELLNAQIQSTKTLQGSQQDLGTMISKNIESRKELEEKIAKHKLEAEVQRQKDEDNYVNLQSDMQSLQQAHSQIVQESQEKDIKIKNLMKSNIGQQSELTQLNLLQSNKQDLLEQLHQVNNFVEELQNQKQLMQKELETAGDYLLESEEKTNKANTAALELLEKLKEADAEIESLKEYIIFLKSQSSQYQAVKGDMIDETLGEYINNYHDKSKLKVMFVRLNPGVYQFGSKKICVGVEQGKINIRVGGGYMVIEEFLDQYTTIELEKSIREGIDPLGGENSPLKVPGSASPRKRLAATNAGLSRSPSPKKLLHRIQSSPVGKHGAARFSAYV